jgi:hypothetical protein
MIIWINGAFGAGKTTTATLVAGLLPAAKLFDPDHLGYLLTSFVDAPTGDFQDLPLWRHLLIETMAGLDRDHPHTWVTRSVESVRTAGKRAVGRAGIPQARGLLGNTQSAPRAQVGRKPAANLRTRSRPCELATPISLAACYRMLSGLQ